LIELLLVEGKIYLFEAHDFKKFVGKDKVKSVVKKPFT